MHEYNQKIIFQTRAIREFTSIELSYSLFKMLAHRTATMERPSHAVNEPAIQPQNVPPDDFSYT